MSWAPIHDEEEDSYDREDNFQMICEGIGRLN